jgi:hypothetical protein
MASADVTPVDASAAVPAPPAQVPQELLCPITFDVPTQPVVAEDGIVYDLEAIDAWLKEKGTSPIQRTRIRRRYTRPPALLLLYTPYLKPEDAAALTVGVIDREPPKVGTKRLRDTAEEWEAEADANVPDTQLRLAAVRGDVAAARAAIDAGATGCVVAHHPLVLAAKNGRLEMVRLLLDRGGPLLHYYAECAVASTIEVYPNTVSAAAETLVQWLLAEGHTASIQALLRQAVVCGSHAYKDRLIACGALPSLLDDAVLVTLLRRSGATNSNMNMLCWLLQLMLAERPAAVHNVLPEMLWNPRVARHVLHNVPQLPLASLRAVLTQLQQRSIGNAMSDIIDVVLERLPEDQRLPCALEVLERITSRDAHDILRILFRKGGITGHDVLALPLEQIVQWDTDMLRVLLTDGNVGVNEPFHGATLLEHEVRMNNREGAHFLAQRGASLYGPLMAAIQTMNLYMVRDLVSYNAPITEQHLAAALLTPLAPEYVHKQRDRYKVASLLFARSRHRYNERVCLRLVLDAARQGNLAALKWLNRQQVDLHMANDAVLVAAVRGGHAAMVRWLLANGCDPAKRDHVVLRTAVAGDTPTYTKTRRLRTTALRPHYENAQLLDLYAARTSLPPNDTDLVL